MRIGLDFRVPDRRCSWCVFEFERVLGNIGGVKVVSMIARWINDCDVASQSSLRSVLYVDFAGLGWEFLERDAKRI